MKRLRVDDLCLLGGDLFEAYVDFCRRVLRSRGKCFEFVETFQFKYGRGKFDVKGDECVLWKEWGCLGVIDIGGSRYVMIVSNTI